MPRIINNMASRFTTLAAGRKAKSKAKVTDTLANVIKLVGANAEKIPVGGGVALKVPDGSTAASHIAKVRGSLTAIGRKGAPWEGRVFNTTVDKETNEVLVMRVADTTEPLPAKVGPTGPRAPRKPKADATPAPATGSTNGEKPVKQENVGGIDGVKNAKAAAVGHLTGKKGGNPPKDLTVN